MASASLEELIAATLATDENARIYVFELDPQDFRWNSIAYDVVYKLKSDPNLDINTLNVQMFEKYGMTYDGFLDKGGLAFQMPEWIQMLNEKKAKEKIIHICDVIIEKGKKEATLEELRTLLVEAEDATRFNFNNDYRKADEVAHDVVEDAMDSWEKGSHALILPLIGDVVMPLWGGEEIIIAGRPSMGKTTFMLELAYQLGVKGIKSGFISLEMDAEQLMRRMCQRFVDVNLRKHLQHLDKFPDQKRKFLDGMAYLKDLPIYFNDKASQSLGGLLMSIEKMAKIEGVKVFFVDYLQLVAPPKKRSRNDEVAAISRALKLVALRNKISIIVGSQLSRNVERQENKRPHLADLRDSGAIEQDADVVAFLYREGYYDKNASEGETEFIIAKQRNGSVGTKKLWFALDRQQFMVETEVKENV